MKCCSKCHIEKDDAEFYSGRNVCKICYEEQKKQYRQNNAEAIKESKKQYYQNNAETIKERRKQYRQNNPETIKEIQKKYYQNNVETIKKRSKHYYENNIETIKERSKQYYQDNCEKQMLQRARRRAKKLNLPFNITEEDINIPELCPILKIPLILGIGKKYVQPNSPSLDRIIPEKGYVKGNIMIISNKANTMKNNATPEEMIKLGEYGKKLLEEAKKNE